MGRASFALGSGATGDPSLYIEPLNLPHSFLIDCGTHHLGHARLLRTRYLFVSHTHLDHFIGFDYWMRVHLAGNHTLHIIGPPGMAEHVYHKIHGYVWNLAETVYLRFRVTELDPLRCFQLLPSERYQLVEAEAEWPVIDSRGDWQFRHAALKHLNIVSYGYRLFTPDQWRVDEEALTATGWKPGPWVREMKSKEEGSIVIEGSEQSIPELRSRLLYHAPGYAITYITDAVYEPENVAKMIDLSRNSDHLFCESSFLKEDEDRARKTHHLTTIQAASIARDAGVGKLHLFHFSRRYAGREHQFLKEARSIFPHTVIGARADNRSGSR